MAVAARAELAGQMLGTGEARHHSAEGQRNDAAVPCLVNAAAS